MSETHTYKPHGVCARSIQITTDGDIIEDVSFKGGCDGNHNGIVRLVRGQKIEDVADILEGTRCGRRSTSCPDQLAKALREIEASSGE